MSTATIDTEAREVSKPEEVKKNRFSKRERSERTPKNSKFSNFSSKARTAATKVYMTASRPVRRVLAYGADHSTEIAFLGSSLLVWTAIVAALAALTAWAFSVNLWLGIAFASFTLYQALVRLARVILATWAVASV